MVEVENRSKQLQRYYKNRIEINEKNKEDDESDEESDEDDE
jgi:hypothetical protein